MERTNLLGGILVALVVVVGIGAALYTGLGPAPGGDSGADIEDFPTEADPDGHETTAPSPADTLPFSFTLDNTAKGGQTRQELNATTHNKHNATATAVTVSIRSPAGAPTQQTHELDLAVTWNVGVMDPAASHTTTKRIELSLQEARTVDQNDGWITILTTVESDTTTVTFQDSEQVA